MQQAKKPGGYADNDTDVDADDLTVWSNQFGQPAPTLAAATVQLSSSPLLEQALVERALLAELDASPAAESLLANFSVQPSNLGVRRFDARQTVAEPLDLAYETAWAEFEPRVHEHHELARTVVRRAKRGPTNTDTQLADALAASFDEPAFTRQVQGVRKASGR